MKTSTFWKFILDQLTAGERVLLLTVVDSEKGSPGKSGFKLAFTAGKKTCGTMGGGIMEHTMIEQYSERLRSNQDVREIRYLVHSPNTKHGEPSGLSCAGSQTNCMLSLSSIDIPVITAIYNSELNHTASKFILTEKGIAYVEGKNPHHKEFHRSGSSAWMYAENIGPEFTVFIVGGGHVGNALSRILATLDLYVVLFDDRSDLSMVRENVFADKKIVAPFSELRTHIHFPEKTFAAIVTSNFATDTVALQQLLPLHLPYIGIMGVEAKIERIKNSLDESGKKYLASQKIHAPIGVEIGSATAEEIAVSIAAEVIKVKNEYQKKNGE